MCLCARFPVLLALFGGTSCGLSAEVKPLLFACLLNKDLRMYPLIRRVGAISLCKFMTVPLKQAAKSRQRSVQEI